MRVFGIRLAVILVLLVTAAFCFAGENPSDSEMPEVVKVGVSAALSGDAAVYSKPFADVMAFMADYFNENDGGIMGKQVEVIAYDDKGSPAAALDIAKKLVYQDHVNILHPGSTSGCILTAMPVGKEEGIPQFGYGLSDAYIQEGEGMIFRAAPTNRVQLGALAKYAAEELGMQTAGMIYLDSQFGENQRDVFTDTFAEYGGQVIKALPYSEGERDFNAIGLELISMNPDGIVIFVQAGPAAACVRQLNDIMPPEMKLIGHNEWTNPTTRSLAGDAITRIDAYNSPIAIRINPDPDVQEWINRIETELNTPFVDEMSRAIVGMQILRMAIEQAGSFDAVAVMKEVHKMQDVPTILGNFTYDPRDGEAIKEALIVRPNGVDIAGDTILEQVRVDVPLYDTPPDYSTYFGADYYNELLKYHGLD